MENEFSNTPENESFLGLLNDIGAVTEHQMCILVSRLQQLHTYHTVKRTIW